MTEVEKFDRMEKQLRNSILRYRAKLEHYIKDDKRFKLHQAIRDAEEQIKVIKGEIDNGIKTIW